MQIPATWLLALLATLAILATASPVVLATAQPKCAPAAAAAPATAPAPVPAPIPAQQPKCVAPAPAPAPVVPAPAPKPTPMNGNRYILLLRDGADQPAFKRVLEAAVAADNAKGGGNDGVVSEVAHEFKIGIKGYSGTFSPRLAKVLAARPEVASVEHDAPISTGDKGEKKNKRKCRPRRKQ
ncbi:hypothetical protein H9P43_006548 [Blastocladiella emersonii ATCC 22665]|nr:hypothetical protein H9P43_006548 [Blastocladiella emersonii ATCC 22665]